MTEQQNDDNKMKDSQMSALAVSATFITFFVIYWALQIETTYSLLAMAYDW